MKRRSILASTAALATSLIAGCSSASREVGDFAEDRIVEDGPQAEEMSVRDINDNIFIQTPEGTEYVEIHQDGSKIHETTPNGRENIASVQPYDPESDEIRVGAGNVVIKAFGQDGEMITEREWQYNPELSVRSIEVGGSSREPDDPARTNLILEIENVGTGPITIKSIDVEPTTTELSIEDKSFPPFINSELNLGDTFLRTRNPNLPGYTMGSEYTHRYTIEGILKAPVDGADWPDHIEQATQRFTITLSTALGEEYSIDVNSRHHGDIQSTASSGEDGYVWSEAIGVELV